MMTLREVADRFDAHHENGQYRAYCPVHEADRSVQHKPSLSIFDGDKGPAVKCWSGCATKDILAAVNLTAADLNAQARVVRDPAAPPVAIYNYFDEHGVLKARKLRFEPKSFAWETPDGLGGFLRKKGSHRGLYNVQAVAAAAHDETIFVVEGEKSVDCLTKHGFVSTCGWTGATTPFTRTYRKLFRGRTVVVVADQDDAGVAHAKTWAQEIAASGATVKLVSYLPMVDTGGDIYDYLASATNVAQSMAELIRTAENFTPASTAPSVYPNTEVGDGEFFAAKYSDDVRFDHRQGRWLISEPKSGLWLPDKTITIYPLAIEAIRDRQSLALSIPDHTAKQAAGNWALKGESRARLNNMLEIAKATSPVADDGEQWDQLTHLLGTPQGVVDLRTGVLRAARPDERVTMRTAVVYDATAACPIFDQALHDIFDGDQDLIDYFIRALGYSLTGDCREEVFFLCYGSGSNGKGTLINTTEYILGDYGETVAFDKLELQDRADSAAAQPHIAKLVSKRLVTASEAKQQVRLNEAVVKNVTGRDPISTRFLHQNEFKFVPEFKLWLSTNHKPKIVDETAGFWRRVQMIPFTVSFEGREDKTLKDKLRAEASGILARIVRGAVAWYAGGLCPPAAVTNATAEYRQENRQIGRYIEDRCDVSEKLRVQAMSAYEDYKAWAVRENEAPYTNKAFWKAFGTRFKADDSGRQTYFVGVGLRAPEQGAFQ